MLLFLCVDWLKQSQLGVASGQPVMIRKAVFSEASSFVLLVLLSQTGAQYSAIEKHSVRVEMHRILAATPHWVPARRRM